MKHAGIAALALSLLAASCASSEKKNQLNIVIGPDGQITAVAPRGASKEQAALAALMSQALNDAQKPLSEEEVWKKEPDGSLIHIQSGAVCPLTWGDMKRERFETIHPQGLDVMCNYESASNFMTFYTYESDLTAEAEAEGALSAMKARQPTAKEAAFSGRGQGFVARTLVYETVDKRSVRTSVLVGGALGWMFKMRVTCLATDAGVYENTAAVALMGQLERQRVAPNGPAPPSPT